LENFGVAEVVFLLKSGHFRGIFSVCVGNPDLGKEFIPNGDLIPEKLAYLGYTSPLFKH
jgi:hypothetical protein